MEIEEEKGMNLQESTEDMEDGSNETIQTNKRQKIDLSTSENNNNNNNNNSNATSIITPIIPIHTVPIVIMEQIFSYLSAPQVQICAFVCKRWKLIYGNFFFSFFFLQLKFENNRKLYGKI